MMIWLPVFPIALLLAVAAGRLAQSHTPGSAPATRRLRVIKPHTAHKTSGTHLHEATLSIKKVQKWLGHSTAAVTAEIYVRDRAGTDAAAARQVAGYLAQ